jgi:hypothetical protein
MHGMHSTIFDFLNEMIVTLGNRNEENRTKERARNNLNNYGTGFLFQATASQEAHSWSTHAIEMVLPGAKRQARMF